MVGRAELTWKAIPITCTSPQVQYDNSRTELDDSVRSLQFKASGPGAR